MRVSGTLEPPARRIEPVLSRELHAGDEVIYGGQTIRRSFPAKITVR